MFKIEKGRFYGWIKFIWIFFLLSMGLIVTFIYMISDNSFGLFGDMPSLEALENPKSELASEIFTADGKSMGRYAVTNRTPLEFEEIAPTVIDALIATEDVRFEQHSGIDLRSMERVLVNTIILQNRSSGGGSTLTQQLAKNLFDTRAKKNRGKLADTPVIGKFIFKIKEWMMAIRLERNYTKKEIITMYLNVSEFSSNSFGIQAAAQTYFSKDASELNVQEAAVLVGMLKAPTMFNPIINRKASINRRNTVLSQMVKYNFLKEADFQKYRTEDIDVKFKSEAYQIGLAPYFKDQALKYLEDWAVKKGYSKDFIKTGGLRIYTTIDSRMQKLAENAVAIHMMERQRAFNYVWSGRNPWVDEYGREVPNFIEKEAKKTVRYKSLEANLGKGNEAQIFVELNKPVRTTIYDMYKGSVDTLISPMDSIRHHKRFLNIGMMAMDPKSGHIKAWVGGINYKHFQYDHVKQSLRQPGSTFKPIVYAAAIDQGYTPCYEIVDKPVIFPGWIPKNSYGSYTYAPHTLRKGMGQSVNTIVAALTKELGIDMIMKYAKNFGINTPLQRVASICLGSSEVSLYELLGAYATFANKGYHIDPMMITKIVDKNGKVLEDFVPDIREVISEEHAYMMLNMLMAGTERGGTGAGIASYGFMDKGNEVGSKTGTTQDHADGWFMGVTRNLVGGVWVGGDTRQTRFLDIGNGQGAVLAMPAFGLFMKSLYADPTLGYKKVPFEKPAKTTVELDCNKALNDRLIERLDQKY